MFAFEVLGVVPGTVSEVEEKKVLSRGKYTDTKNKRM
jgi:hypothetical protein